MKKAVLAVLTILGAAASTSLQAEFACTRDADCREWARANCPAGVGVRDAYCYRAGTAEATCVCGGMAGSAEPISQ